MFQNISSEGRILDAGEVTELEDLFYLFWEKPFEVHVLLCYDNVIVSLQI